MPTLDVMFDWLASTAAVCLVVLAVGAALAYCWSRPIERLRSIQATFVALVAACLLQSFHVLPQVSLGLLPEPPEGTGRADVARSLSDGASGPTGTQQPLPGWPSAQGSHEPVKSAADSADTSAPVTGKPDAVPEPDGHKGLSLAASVRAAFVVTLLAGSGVVLLTLGLGIVRLRCLVAHSQPAAPEIGQLLQAIQESRPHRVPVLMSADIDVPLTFGVRRPVIVLPASLAAAESPATLRYYLAHEWAHIRHYDVATWWMLQWLQPLVWFQPLYWILRRELRVCQDQLADQFASALGPDPVPYAQLLLRLAQSRHLRQTGVALTMSAGRSTLHRRILTLLSSNRHLASVCRLRAPAVSALVLVIVTALAGALNFGDDRAQAARRQDDEIEPPMRDLDPNSIGRLAQTSHRKISADHGSSRSSDDASHVKALGHGPADDRIDAEGTDKPTKKKPQQAPNTHLITVVGKALGSEGKPIKGATIFLVCNSPEKTIGQTTTDQDGRYEFRDAALPVRPPDKDAWEQASFEVFGKAAGHAFAWTGTKTLYLDPRFSEPFVGGLSKEDGFFPGEKIELNLTFAPPKRIHGRFIDEKGTPIAGVNVKLVNCDYLSTAGKDQSSGPREFAALYRADTLMPEEVLAKSDLEGRFEFKSVPPDVVCRLFIQHPGEENASFNHGLFTSTADKPPAEWDRGTDRGYPIVKLPLDVTLHTLRAVPVRVMLGHTERPAVGVRVIAHQQLAVGNSANGTTDKEGKATLKLPPGSYNLYVDPTWNSGDYIRTYQKLVVEDRPAEQPAAIPLKPGCVLILKAVDAETGAGVLGVTFWEMDDQGRRGTVYSNTWLVNYPETNQKGELRAVVNPGTRRYGIDLRKPLPDGYQMIDKRDQDAGRELHLPAEKAVTAEFKLRKLKN